MKPLEALRYHVAKDAQTFTPSRQWCIEALAQYDKLLSIAAREQRDEADLCPRCGNKLFIRCRHCAGDDD